MARPSWIDASLDECNGSVFGLLRSQCTFHDGRRVAIDVDKLSQALYWLGDVARPLMGEDDGAFDPNNVDWGVARVGDDCNAVADVAKFVLEWKARLEVVEFCCPKQLYMFVGVYIATHLHDVLREADRTGARALALRILADSVRRCSARSPRLACGLRRLQRHLSG